jgi:hypothetical protein
MKRLLLAALIIWALPTPALAKPWTHTRLRAEVSTACRIFHLSAADRAWLRPASVDIVFALPGKPAKESSGARHNMFQYEGGWDLGKKLRRIAKREKHHHGKHGWLDCRRCSTRRMVRGYAIVKAQRGTSAAKAWVRAKWPTLGH